METNLPLLVWLIRLKKIKQGDNNCVLCSRDVKWCNETKLKSPLLDTLISNFRKAVQVLDMVQVLHKLPNCMNIFLQNLHSLCDVWNITKDEGPINMSIYIYIYIYPPGWCKQIVTVQKQKLLPRFCTSSPAVVTFLYFFLYPQIKHKWDTACLTAVGIQNKIFRDMLRLFWYW